jgi:hypothetical protein
MFVELLKSSFKAFSDHSQLVALIMESTKSVFINSTSRVIMNFKIKQKIEGVRGKKGEKKPINKDVREIDNSLFLC